MNNFEEKNALTGKLLIATPLLNGDDFFDHAVVYICSHGRNGAMGIVINKRLEQYTFSDLTMQLPLENYNRLNEIRLYAGGPLEQVRGMVLHSTDYIKDGTVVISNGIAISSTNEIIADIAFNHGPEDKLVALGYSFWQPQQLETEIFRNDWLIVDADKQLLFNTEDAYKWQQAVQKSGIALDRFVGVTGYA